MTPVLRGALSTKATYKCIRVTTSAMKQTHKLARQSTEALKASVCTIFAEDANMLYLHIQLMHNCRAYVVEDEPSWFPIEGGCEPFRQLLFGPSPPVERILLLSLWSFLQAGFFLDVDSVEVLPCPPSAVQRRKSCLATSTYLYGWLCSHCICRCIHLYHCTSTYKTMNQCNMQCT